MKQQKIVYLTPPRISVMHIKEKVSCIRAHRERIFQVATTLYQNKLICHNYGHGGAGWTFLFGAVHESIRQFKQRCIENHAFANQSIIIIGAGCHGLLTAILLARQGYTVSIVAYDVTTIPSYKAAGFFFPRARKSSTQEERSLFKNFGIESYRTYQEIVDGKHPFIRHGAKLLPAYYGCDIDPGFSDYIKQGLMQAPERVTVDFNNGKMYELMEYKTLFIDTQLMMQELHRNIQLLGIPITQSFVHAWDELAESVIFNCSGYGAKHLAGDQRVIPVQGHLITLQEQPDTSLLQYMINVKVVQYNDKGMPRDELIYFAPKESGILGITFKRGQDSLTANEYEFDRLLERCIDYFGPKAP